MATASASSLASLHSVGGMPHGLGLLTTVASLPPKYRSRYLNIKTKCEIPLDLSVKPISPQIAKDVPMATNFTEVYTEPSSIEQTSGEAAEIFIASIARAVEREEETEAVMEEAEQSIIADNIIKGENKLMSPPTIATTIATPTPTPTPTPIKRKWAERDREETERESAIDTKKLAKLPKTNIKEECTPIKPIRVSDGAPRTVKSQPVNVKSGKNKATRKLKFDEETSSPVSGTIIRPLEDITDGTVQYSNGDIDPRYNIVEITEETKAELAAIKNVIGDYICKLCRIKFEDAFGLARHRCACIVLLEYRCPECGKQFNCPANLASHRRWHKPKKNAELSGAASGGGGVTKKENRQNNSNTLNSTQQQSGGNVGNSGGGGKGVCVKNVEIEHSCNQCGKQFKRLAYLRKHQLTHTNGKKQKSTSTVPLASVSVPVMLVNGSNSSSVVGGGNSSGGYQSYASSTASSIHSFVTGTSGHDDVENEHNFTVRVATNHHHGHSHGDDYDVDSLSDCSSDSSSTGYGRLQIVESGLTEEENIAAAALTNLRNCASVIQHTTMAH